MYVQFSRGGGGDFTGGFAGMISKIVWVYL